jgi:acetoin utilization protein AcuB
MAFPYRKILCPVDFDDNSLAALGAAAEIVRHSDGTVFVLHIVPMVVAPTGMPVYADIYRSQEESAWANLRAIARRELAAVKYELLVDTGDPAGSILRMQKKIAPDVLVMATHGRKGFSRFFLGSVAEMVIREATCPVLMVRAAVADKHLVGKWMTHDPMVAAPDEKLSAVEGRMREGSFRTIPVMQEEKLVGIITDRDIRRHVGFLEHTEVLQAMTEDLITVSPSASLREAARLMRERKIGGLPVVEDGKLVGIITTTDLLRAFSENDTA